MKAVISLTLLPLMILANPIVSPESNGPETAGIDKRSVTCALTASNVRYRRGPGTSYRADGQFGAAGTLVSFSCYTSGEAVNGNYLWNRIASGTGAGDYVSDTFITRQCSDLIQDIC